MPNSAFILQMHQSHLVSPRALCLVLFCFSYILITFQTTSFLTCTSLLMTLLYTEKLYLKMTTVSWKLTLKNSQHGLRPGKWILMSQSVTWCSYNTKTNHSLFPYSMLNQALSCVHHIIYLGVTIDSNLSLNEHITLIVAKSCKTLGLVKRTLRPSKPSVKETAYKILVQPKLGYGAVACNLCNDRRTTSVTSLLNKLSWQTLEWWRLQTQLTVLYKIHHCLLQIKIPPVILSSGAQIRNGKPINMYKSNGEPISIPGSFHLRTIHVWNSFPANMLACPSLSTFQSAVWAQSLTLPAHLVTY